MIVLSAVQFKPRLAYCPADITDNFRRLLPWLNQAVVNNSSLIVLPELACTGYAHLSFDEAMQVAEPQQGATFRRMSNFAKANGCLIAYGYIEIGSDERLYNSANLVSQTGELLATHRKANLWGPDFLWATSGTTPAPVVDTDIGRVSVLVCRDLRNKIPKNVPTSHVASILADDNVDIVCACTNWGRGSGFPSNSWMDFSADQNCTLVVSNRWGVEINDTYELDFGQGGCAVIEPSWKVNINGMRFNQDCVVNAVVEERLNV